MSSHHRYRLMVQDRQDRQGARMATITASMFMALDGVVDPAKHRPPPKPGYETSHDRSHLTRLDEQEHPRWRNPLQHRSRADYRRPSCRTRMRGHRDPAPALGRAAESVRHTA